MDSDLIETYEGKEGATEGKTYARITLPHMLETMADFDGDAYLVRWDDWIGAIVSGDADAASSASAALPGAACNAVNWGLCAIFQTSACSRPPEPMSRTFIGFELSIP